MAFTYTNWTRIPGSPISYGLSYPAVVGYYGIGASTIPSSTMVNGQIVANGFRENTPRPELIFQMSDGGLVISAPETGTVFPNVNLVRIACFIRAAGGTWSLVALDPTFYNRSSIYQFGSCQVGDSFYISYYTYTTLRPLRYQATILRATYAAGAITSTTIVVMNSSAAYTSLSLPMYDTVNNLIHIIVGGQLRAYSLDLGTLVYTSAAGSVDDEPPTIINNNIYVPYNYITGFAHVAVASASSYTVTPESGDNSFAASGQTPFLSLDVLDRVIVGHFNDRLYDRTAIGLIQSTIPPDPFNQIQTIALKRPGTFFNLIIEQLNAPGTNADYTYPELSFQVQGTGDLLLLATRNRPDLEVHAYELVYCLRTSYIAKTLLVPGNTHRPRATAQFVG